MNKWMIMLISSVLMLTACGDKKSKKSASGPVRVNAKQFPAETGTALGAWNIPLQSRSASVSFDGTLFINRTQVILEVVCSDKDGRVAVAIAKATVTKLTENRLELAQVSEGTSKVNDFECTASIDQPATDYKVVNDRLQFGDAVFDRK